MKYIIALAGLLAMTQSALFAQTSIEEYNFLSQGYSNQLKSGQRPKMDGYYLEDLLELSSKKGKVRLFYKDNHTDMVPKATQFELITASETYFICIPHENSDRSIFNRYSEDIQNIFSKNPEAQSIFSILMVQYPIELQKFYDEIIELEKTLALNEPKSGASAPIAAEPIITRDTPKNANAGTDASVAIIKKNDSEEVVIKNYDAPQKERAAASGKTTNELSSVLQRRNLIARPELVNETGKAGEVRVDVCLDPQGRVMSAIVNESHSNTRDTQLRSIAVGLSKQYRFGVGHSSRECGYLVFKFN